MVDVIDCSNQIYISRFYKYFLFTSENIMVTVTEGMYRKHKISEKVLYFKPNLKVF